MTETKTQQRPRIFRVTVQTSDGKRKSRLIKAPYYEREPHASLYGLTSRLDDLVMEGRVLSYSVRVPSTITNAQRERLDRWTQVLGELVPAGPDYDAILLAQRAEASGTKFDG